MKKDSLIRADIAAELEWNSSLDGRNIGIAVKDGVVTLTGQVSSFMARFSAEAATRRVSGVRAVANDIEVALPGSSLRTDTDIAEAALTALGFNAEIPEDSITPVVRNGWLTLSGTVASWYQKNVAEDAVKYLRGVKGITNDIAIVPKATAHDIKVRIEGAFQRHAIKDSKAIRVTVADGTVTLEGSVHNWQESDDAQSAAWSGAGVANVRNLLVVTP